MNTTINAKDVISGATGNCYVTIGEERINFATVTDFESKEEITITDVFLLGEFNVQHKITGGKGTFSCTIYYNQPFLRRVALALQKTWLMPSITIQVSNADPESAAGRQTIIHRNCMCSAFTLAKLTSKQDVLTEDISGVFGSFEIPQEFTPLQEMLQ